MKLFDQKSDPRKLMERAREGDERAFEQLYVEFAVPLFRYVYVRVGRKEDAEDILQTVFLKVYKALGEYRDQGKEPISFFYAVARNAVIDYQRKRKDIAIEDIAELGDYIADDVDVPDHVARRNEAMHIHKILGSISEDQSEVLILKFVQDLTNKEMAVVLGKTEESVRQLQSRGLKALREQLEIQP